MTRHPNWRLVGNKLNIKQAREAKFSSESAKVLAERFGVKPSAIHAIRRGISWAWLEDDMTQAFSRSDGKMKPETLGWEPPAVRLEAVEPEPVTCVPKENSAAKRRQTLRQYAEAHPFGEVVIPSHDLLALLDDLARKDRQLWISREERHKYARRSAGLVRENEKLKCELAGAVA